jgi:hypothetical protein
VATWPERRLNMAASEASAGSTRAIRREYVSALVSQSWARPDTPRPVARPHVVLMVAVFAAAGAVAAGVLLQLIHPVARPKPTVVAPPPPVSVAPFTAVTGWDCGPTGDRGFDVSGRTGDWYTVAKGGWIGDGCHGTFEAIPMTGDPAKDDPDQFAVWWFTPTKGLTRCDIQVLHPLPDRRQDAAATAAQYYVLAGRNGARLAGFVVDQSAAPGTWVDVGEFPVSQNGIAVQLVDRGAPSGAGDRLAVGQIRVGCKA